jgi:hypothetical protein
MKLSSSAILQLSHMICGDETYQNIFPRRTLGGITQFFYSIDWGAKPEPMIARKKYALDNLEKINVETVDASGNSDVYPSLYILNAIKELLNPIHFNQSFDYQKAMDIMNNVLRGQGLSVFIDKSNEVCVNLIHGEFVSTAVDPRVERYITFCPEVFKVPDCKVNSNLVAVMMPFSIKRKDVYTTIESSCKSVNMECIRSDHKLAWVNSEIFQDIFRLIFSSSIVITDFSGKNKNVYYEAGIAHTLGKHVIPLAHSKSDLPFDVDHHRAIFYDNTSEGLDKLKIELVPRLITLKDKIIK